ncbi:phosphate ABC transporter ATP-binding protein [Sporosarcina sp. Te-1]|uniref:ABC transporter ATP-binding protein n=1 Tax=Sporosarcina sp. Te-1 TaxID=2818390 RepID=UPI001A9DBD26|nr:phosphate ABC transporter ATP-binding protein [Sporosarcina sp. Te-1]QTD43065.1 phosphate ABC transporter ATP-binding protein [Sporosarcina sp. Te-1]
MAPHQLPAFQFQNIHYTINRTAILKNITGSIPKAKITALVGPSGAGKTTLLKLCNGLLSPTAGSIFVEGQPIDQIAPPTLRRHVGMVLQNSPMIKGTVFDNLALPLRLQGRELDEGEAVALLEKTGLKRTFLRSDVLDLSGGQRQKVSIARTLANTSTILLFDEITSALDRTSVHEIEELVKELKQANSTSVIWITHNLEQAIRVSDYLWVMMDGEVVEMGGPTILESPTNERVAKFVKGEQL